jgi:hypothetical protein
MTDEQYQDIRLALWITAGSVSILTMAVVSSLFGYVMGQLF